MAEDRHWGDDRDVLDRTGDDVRSWLGDDETPRRSEDTHRERGWHLERWNGPPKTPERWGEDASSVHYPPRYSSGRPYGDRDYLPDESRRVSAETWGRAYPNPTERPTRARRQYGSHPGFGVSDWGPAFSREWGAQAWHAPGPHTGRGPRGYQRSDARILEDLYDRLTVHGFIDATEIVAEVNGGEVTLTGFVDSRAAKYAAEDTAADVPGVIDVRNQLRVRNHQP